MTGTNIVVGEKLQDYRGTITGVPVAPRPDVK